ncbi:MAG: hypothetical protein Q9169_006503 [Polycauliona sp. 2 TL-2023]
MLYVFVTSQLLINHEHQGLSYTLSTTTIPPLLALPSATPAHSTFRHLRTLTSRHQVLLSSLSVSTLVMAYLLSPTQSRHPYLLWATLATAAGWGHEAVSKVFGKKQGEQKPVTMVDNENRRGNSMRKEGSWTEDEEWISNEEGDVNGEVLSMSSVSMHADQVGLTEDLLLYQQGSIPTNMW